MYASALTPSAGTYSEVRTTGCKIIWYMGISPIMAWVDDHVFVRVLQEHLKEYNQLQLGWHKDITTRGCCHDGGCIWYGVEFWKNLMRTAIFICKTFLTIHLAVKQMLSMHITSVTLTEFWKNIGANEGPLILFLHGIHQVWIEPLNNASFCGREGKDKMSQFHFQIDGKFHTPTQQHSKTL